MQWAIACMAALVLAIIGLGALGNYDAAFAERDGATAYNAANVALWNCTQAVHAVCYGVYNNTTRLSKDWAKLAAGPPPGRACRGELCFWR